MFYLERLKQEFSNCACGREHACAIKDIRIGSKLTHRVGEILKANGFPEKILLVADKKTLKAAQGILRFGRFQSPLGSMMISDTDRRKPSGLQLAGGGVLVVGTGSRATFAGMRLTGKTCPSAFSPLPPAWTASPLRLRR